MRDTYFKFMGDYGPMAAIRQREQLGGVTVLMAVESGSRSWGFASRDSDYDVRFVYMRDAEFYLRLQDVDDVIEVSAEHDGILVDAVGWDIQKFLRLVKKSNAQPFEWLFTCPVYASSIKELEFIDKARMVTMNYLNWLQMAYHYRGMATKHWYRYIEGKDEVTHKKYLYLLRAIFNMLWYLNNEGFIQQVAPGETTGVLESLSPVHVPLRVREEFYDLISAKKSGKELGLDRPNQVFDEYIADTVEKYKGNLGGISGTPGWDGLNEFFVHLLKDYGKLL